MDSLNRGEERVITSPWLAAKTLQSSESSSTATEEQSKSRCRVRLSVAALILERRGLGSGLPEECEVKDELSDEVTGLRHTSLPKGKPAS